MNIWLANRLKLNYQVQVRNLCSMLRQMNLGCSMSIKDLLLRVRIWITFPLHIIHPIRCMTPFVHLISILDNFFKTNRSQCSNLNYIVKKQRHQQHQLHQISIWVALSLSRIPPNSVKAKNKKIVMPAIRARSTWKV